MKLRTVIFGVLVLCLWHMPAQAVALVLQCPPSLSSRQAVQGEVPPTWSVRAGGKPVATEVTSSHRLEGVMFSAGDPEGEAWLMEDILKKRAGRATLTRVQTTPSQPLFMSCFYQGTLLQVTQAVPASYVQCETSWDVGTRPATPMQTVCRSAKR